MSGNVDGSRVIVMVLGNKCDLPNREVSYNEGMEYARQRNFGFLEVSAKTGTNIKNSFYCLVRGKQLYLPILQYLEIYKAQMREQGIEIGGNDQNKKAETIQLKKGDSDAQAADNRQKKGCKC